MSSRGKEGATTKDFAYDAEAAANLSAIEAALKRGGNKQCVIAELNGLNHLFQKAESGDVAEYAVIEESVNAELLNILSGWIYSLQPKNRIQQNLETV